jgi:tetratricopeptide (TPR) repeat protein
MSKLESGIGQNAEALVLMGKTLLQKGQPDQAENALHQALKIQPGEHHALEYMGAVYLSRQDAGRAAGWLRKAIEIGGGNIARHNNLGSALYLLNRIQESVREHEKALDLEPDNIKALMGVARGLQYARDYERAVAYYRRVEELDPAYGDAIVAQGRCLYELNYLPRAMECYRKVLKIRPEDQEVQLCYGQLLCLQGHYHEAISYLDPLVKEPDYRKQAREALVPCLLTVGDLERVEAISRELLDSVDDSSRVSQWLAAALSGQGRMDEAREVLEEAVANLDYADECWLQLEELRELTDQEIATVRDRFYTLPAEKKIVRGELAFALSNWHEKRQERAAQMEWLDIANQLISETRSHDPDRMERYGASLREALTRETMPELARGGDRDYQPVFIVGMPRSGTTLLEQILGAHPALTPVGENPLVAWVFRQELDESRWAGIQHLTPEVVNGLAARYRGFMEERYGRGRIVEKAISNDREAGLLYCMFPRARFIEIRRHPLDVALGCYKQLFIGQNFSFQVDDIAREMKVYEDMMAHWHEHLPVPIHTVRYEELVTNQDEVTRTVLEFLGLGFDPKCLKFHEQDSRVTTASANQVRRGVYSSAVGRWQAYGDLLDPFREALHQHGVPIPGNEELNNG